MTDMIESQLDAVDNLDIATLRKFAALAGVKAKRDWSKEDFIAAIKTKQEEAGATLVFDTNLGPKPGYSRILLHRDPTPGSKNTPVHAGINGHIFAIPRGVAVDVPNPLVEVLANAITVTTEEHSSANGLNPMGTYRDTERLSYPFQVIQVTPGEYKNKQDGRSAHYAIREEFWRNHGVWPTAAELAEYRKAKFNKSA